MKILLYKTQPEIIKSQIFMRFNVIHLLIVKRLSNEFAIIKGFAFYTRWVKEFY